MLEEEERPVADRMDDIALPSETLSLVGHEAALNRLQMAHRSNRLHHAWLLSGPRGIGKATLAFQFARQLLAYPNGSALPPVGQQIAVPASVSGPIMRGAHPELLHLTRPWDEKAKRFKTKLSVDEVRKTQAFYGMTAGAGGWRITIVDAADDMNAEAANALLKVLEEPPKRSLFLVLSHASGGLLPTIRSRCQMVPLQPLSEAEVGQVLQRMDLQIDPALLSAACERSEGSVRRAIQLVRSDALKEIAVFENLLVSRSTGVPRDWMQVHGLADRLVRKGAEEGYELFFDLALDALAKDVRNHILQSGVEGAKRDPALLAGQAEVWEKTVESKRVADAYNLDKKQEILSLFSALFDLNSRA